MCDAPAFGRTFEDVDEVTHRIRAVQWRRPGFGIAANMAVGGEVGNTLSRVFVNNAHDRCHAVMPNDEVWRMCMLCRDDSSAASQQLAPALEGAVLGKKCRCFLGFAVVNVFSKGQSNTLTFGDYGNFHFMIHVNVQSFQIPTS